MYYIANKVLETAEKLYTPGDVIPEFSSWDNVVQRAHLNQGNVERMQGQPEGDRSTGTVKADAARALAEEETAAAAAKEAASSGDPTTAEPGDRNRAALGDGEDGEGEDTDDEDPYAACRDGEILHCPGCEGSIFTTEGGLRKHLKKAHNGSIPARATPKVEDAAFAKLAPPPSKAAKRVPGLMSEFGANPSLSDSDD